MSSYAYEAVDAGGVRTKGSIDVLNQSEALRRIKEMGLFPTMVRPVAVPVLRPRFALRATRRPFRLPGTGRVKSAVLTTFTRQLATLVNVGMPLLRGLRLLREQEANPAFKRVIGEIAYAVETGGTMSEALAAHPKIFSPLYVNMVRAGEMGGVLEQVLRRQAELMEKAQRIKGKVQAALFYPIAVLLVAAGITTLLLTFVIPRFREVFAGLLPGQAMPAFTVAVMNISDVVRSHFLSGVGALAMIWVAFICLKQTAGGRRLYDRAKLALPVIGNLTRKISLARFARTLGTLLGSGVPILQALNIVKQSAGNVIIADLIGRIHDNVKEGGTLAEPFKAAAIFPPIVSGMVDVGEQTGALPEMLLKIADTSDEDVDNAATAMTSLLEPVMIIFLAVVVGSIVIAMFLPLFRLMGGMAGVGGGGQ